MACLKRNKHLKCNFECVVETGLRPVSREKNIFSNKHNSTSYGQPTSINQ